MQKQYRKCVGIVVYNHQNKVLMCERIDTDNAWQFPQGGLNEGENFIEASKRELWEETSIRSVSFISSIDAPMAYDFPKPKVVDDKTFDGQEMCWVLYHFTGAESEINLETPVPEFKRYGWFDLEEAPDKIVGFKKDVYTKMTERFKDYLKG